MDAERREHLETQLSAYLDGELMPQERAEVEAWLEADPQARQLLAQLRATVSAVHSLPRARASEELLGNLRTRLERQALLDGTPEIEPAPTSRTRSWSRWVAVAAVIALTFTAGYFTWTLREQESVGPQFAHKEAKPRSLEPVNAPVAGERLAARAEHLAKDKKTELGGTSTSPSLAAAPAARPPAEPMALTMEMGEGEELAAEVAKATAPDKPVAVRDTLAVAGKSIALAGVEVADSKAKSAVEDVSGLIVRADSDGDGTPDGRRTADTSVLAMSFADADSRAKVIDALSRELQMGLPTEEARRELRSSASHAMAQQGAGYGELSPAARPTRASGAPEPPKESAPQRPSSVAGAKGPETQAPAGDLYDAGMAKTTGSMGMGGYGMGGMGGMGAVGGMGGMMGGFDLQTSGAVRIDSIEGERSSPVNVMKMNVTDPAVVDRVVVAINERARAGGATVVHELSAARLALSARSKEARDAVGQEGAIGGDSRQSAWEEGDDVVSGDGVADTLRGVPQSQPGQAVITNGTLSDYSWRVEQSQPEQFRYVTDADRLLEPGKAGDTPATAMNGPSRQDWAIAVASRPTAGGAASSSEGVDSNFRVAMTPAPKNEVPQREAAIRGGTAGRSRAGTGTSPALAQVTDEVKHGELGRGFDDFTIEGDGDDLARIGEYRGSLAAPATKPAPAVIGTPASTNLLVVYLRVAPPETQPAVPATPLAPPTTRAASQPTTAPGP